MVAAFDKNNALAVIELIISVIVAGVLANVLFLHDHSSHRTQFIDCVIYGFMIINVVHVISIFGFDTQLPKPTRLIFSGLGAIFYLTTAALIFEHASYFRNFLYSRILTGGIFSLIECVVYGVDIFLVHKVYKTDPNE